MSFLYLKHFELERPPFQITPDTDFFFSGSQRGGILTGLLHVACHEEGIVTAVAEVGSGKTLLARLLISRLPATISTVYLANPCFNRDEIITAISRDLGLDNVPASTEENLARLHKELLRRHAEGLRVLLVIDEAHAMPPESLEEVRMLSNLETDRHKLVNIMLFGQPELDTLLADRRLRQVKDRVIHRFELPPLQHDEVRSYIDHRLRIAGWRGDKLLTSEAIALLIKASGGRARRINLLADKSLLAAYAEGARQVEKRHVKVACDELSPATASRFAGLDFRWFTTIAAFALGIAVTGIAIWIVGQYRLSSSPRIEAAEPSAIRADKGSALASAVPAAKAGRVPVAASTPAKALAPVTPPIQRSADPALVPESDGSASEPSDTSDKWVPEIVKHTEAVVADPNWHGFTVQLATLSSMDNLARYVGSVRQYVDLKLIYAHKRTYNGKDSVAVYFGSFATEQAAKEALHGLPEAFRVDQPVIRTWAGIRREPNP